MRAAIRLARDGGVSVGIIIDWHAAIAGKPRSHRGCGDPIIKGADN
jgi:hypothetical protein